MYLPDINWERYVISGHQYSRELNLLFLKCLNDCNLDQLVNFPQRRDNIFDILLATNNTLTFNISDVPGIGDHTRIPVADVLCHPTQ